MGLPKSAHTQEEAQDSNSIEVKEQVAVESIAKKKEMIAVDREAIEEKELAKEGVRSKEREAALLQKEAEVLNAQADISDDENLRKKAKEAETQAQQAIREAAVMQETLTLAEDKARFANERIMQSEREINALRKELYEIKLQSVGLGGMANWMNRPLFYIGDTSVTLGGVGSAIVIIFAALFLSAILQRIIIGKLSRSSRLRSGVSYAISRMVHYVIIILAFIIAAQCVGINFGSLAVVFGFLSVGIGFGLQNVTSNFISGLILLFERPISVGDFVTVDNQVGTVRQINMRASLIETTDNVRIIVPNSKFIEGNVTNWSHGSTKIRVHCPVGVAYGSDISKVREALLQVAGAHKDVLKNPEPVVRFLKFGDSSLDFELLVWMDEPESQYALQSEINYEIDAIFRQSNIAIPFPQRDLHIKSPLTTA